MSDAGRNPTHEVDFSVEVDSAYDDGDIDMMSATTSIRSTITDYIYENGRRYHAYRAGEYWGPNDELQSDAMDVFHHMCTLTMRGKLFLAPIDASPQRCLDVGTGTGIWAIDFADHYPDCQVIGTDLSPIQPRQVPPNLQFEIDDACSEWVYTAASFDFIHVRGLYGSVADWPMFYQEVLKHLRPGAYFEQLETGVVPMSDDGSIKPGTSLDRWGPISVAAGDAFGKSLRCVNETKQHMIDAGFEDIVEHRYKMPIGSWSKDKRLKEIGLFNRLLWEQAIDGWCLQLFTKILGWDVDDVKTLTAGVRSQLADRSVHAYYECSIVYGRRPGV